MLIAAFDISASRARAVVIKSTLGALKETGAEEFGLPLSGPERGEALKQALSIIKDKHGISGVVFGIDARHFIHNYIELPLTSERDIREALRFEIAKHLPLSADEYVHDFLIIERKPNASRCLVFSVRTDRLEWLKDALLSSGLSLMGVRADSLEALNEFISTGPKTNAVFICEGEDSWHVFGLKNAAPVALKTAYNASMLQAEASAMASSLGAGIYYAGRRAGEMQGMRGLSYNMPYLIAQGALKHNKINLDFSPPGIGRKVVDYHPLLVKSMMIAGAIALFAAPLLGYYKDYAALRRVESRINEIKQTASGVVEIRREIESLEDRRGYLSAFLNSKNSHIAAIAELSRVMPEDSWLTSFSADETGKIEIEGFSSKRAANIIKPIESSPMFKDVSFTSPVTMREGGERFTVKMEREQ